MADLKALFDTAITDSKSLATRPDNATLLKLYALFKQATAGDVSGDRPGGFDFVGQAKFDAWRGLEGTSTETAMQQYVDLVNALKG